MSKKRTHEQMLFDLAVNEGPDVVHLPYTPEFEAVCQQLNPQATTADKHLYWEKLLKIKESVASDAEPDSSATPTPTVDVASPRFIPRATEAAHVTTPAPSSGYLFPIEEDITELQPWSSPTEPELQPAHSERRQKLLAEIANSHLATREQQVAYILQRFPETRDSDTALCIRYWRTFQADILEKWSTLELEVLYDLDRIETLGRVRRIIQNDLRLFRGIEDTRRARNAMQVEIYEYLAAHRDSLPEVRFYLDETGNEGDKSYTGIAGICIINWKQFEKHSAALEQWRSRQGWPETIHFSETGANKVDRGMVRSSI